MWQRNRPVLRDFRGQWPRKRSVLRLLRGHWPRIVGAAGATSLGGRYSIGYEAAMGRTLLTVVASLAFVWLALIAVLLGTRPRGASLREAARLLPDTLRLVKRLAGDAGLATGIRVRLWLLLAYLAMPFDLVPDFIPVLGWADDVILVCLVLRSVVRRAGAEAVRRHWPGTPEGLAVLWRVAGLPATASDSDAANRPSGDS